MHASGVMWVKDISLVPVSEREEFVKYRGILIALWALAIAGVIKSVFSKTGMSIGWIFALIISAGIVSGALLPESIKKYIDRSLLSEVYSDGQALEPTLSSGISNSQAGSVLQEFSIYKYGHFALFSLLAAVAILNKLFKKPLACLLGYLVLFALCTEVWQFFIDGSEPRVVDFLIDVSGIAAGSAIAWLCTRRFLSHQCGV